MKCPYCDYEHGWSGDKMESVKGAEGDFFNLSNQVQMRRDNEYRGYGDETRSVFGCPSCNKIFMGD